MTNKERKTAINISIAKVAGYTIREYQSIRPEDDAGKFEMLCPEGELVGTVQMGEVACWSENAPRYTDSVDACYAVSDAKGWDVYVNPIQGGFIILITPKDRAHELLTTVRHRRRTEAFALALVRALGIDTEGLKT